MRRAAEARRILDALDPRGTWTKLGTIGRANRLVFAYAAKDMILRVGRGPSDGSVGDSLELPSRIIPLRENDTVEIFLGPQSPPERILTSADFARNLTRLADYFTTLR